VWTVHIAHDVSRAERQEEALLLIQHTLRILNRVGNENIKNTENGNSYHLPHLRKAERFESLTRRELDVLQLLVGGLSTFDISKKLYISQDTVRNHVRHLLAKTGTHNRTQLAIFALRNGYC
jgi:DNA-binding NarL/FixJ family response regulator